MNDPSQKLALYCLGKSSKAGKLHIFINGNGRLCRRPGSGPVSCEPVGFDRSMTLAQAAEKLKAKAGCACCKRKINRFFEKEK